MPKLKNSAASAIWPAVRAARGSSIIVPIGASHAHLGEDLLGLLADQLELLHRADERDHDLGPRVEALVDQGLGGLGERPHLQREQAGDDQPEADAAQPEHRVHLVQPADLVEQPHPRRVRRLAARLGDRAPRPSAR